MALDKTFDANSAETRIYEAWEKIGAFRAGANAKVIAAAPNLQVMAAFLSGPGVIGNFIGRHPGHREALLAHFVHFRPGVLIGGDDGVAVKGRARLDGELIHR